LDYTKIENGCFLPPVQKSMGSQGLW